MKAPVFKFSGSHLSSLLLVTSFLLLTSCGGPDILVVRDQYWKVTDFDQKIENKIQKVSEQLDETVAYVDLSFPLDTAAVTESITRANPKVALLSPLFSADAVEVATQEGERRIVAFGLGTGNIASVENLSLIVTDRRDAFRRAGALCRRFLDYPGNETRKVAGLFYSGGRERASERAAFEEGIGDVSGNRVFIQTFPRLDGIGQVNTYLSGLADEDVGIFFVSMSGIDRDVLAAIITRNQAFFIAEWLGDAGGVVPYEDRVLAMVREDWIGVFSFNLSGAGPEIDVETVLLPGPASSSPSSAWVGDFFAVSDGG